MPQLHFYAPDELAHRIQQEAQTANMSVSGYLGDLVRRNLAPQWPEGYFEDVVGGWLGDDLERPPQGVYEQREPLELGQ